MTTIHETYDEQHVQAVIVYGNGVDNKLYVDEAFTVEAAPDELLSLFKKKLLLIAAGTGLFVPIAADFDAVGRIMIIDLDGDPWVWNEPVQQDE